MRVYEKVQMSMEHGTSTSEHWKECTEERTIECWKPRREVK